MNGLGESGIKCLDMLKNYTNSLVGIHIEDLNGELEKKYGRGVFITHIEREGILDFNYGGVRNTYKYSYYHNRWFYVDNDSLRKESKFKHLDCKGLKEESKHLISRYDLKGLKDNLNVEYLYSSVNVDMYLTVHAVLFSGEVIDFRYYL